MADDPTTPGRRPRPRSGKRPTPPHWKELMDRRGIPSIRQLTLRTELSQPTVEGVIYGDSKSPSSRTMAAIAQALDIPLSKAYELAGTTMPHADIWEPPAEAHLLTPRQRAAFEDLIRAVVDPGHQAPTKAPSNVHHLRTNYEGLHPERDELDVASDRGHGPSEGQLRWEQMNLAGEESQDPEDGQK